jgi:hypothetical protein
VKRPGVIRRVYRSDSESKSFNPQGCLILPYAAREKLAALEPDLPSLPEGAPEDDPDDEGWLFDPVAAILSSSGTTKNGRGGLAEKPFSSPHPDGTGRFR